MQIESVVRLDKRKSKVLTDEGHVFVLYIGELKKYGLQEGGELTPEVYDRILREVLFKRARERCLYLLKARDRTEQELRRKLKEGYYPQEAIENAVAFLKEYRFVDDEKYCREYIRVYGGKRSRRQLEFELRNKGLSPEAVEGFLEENPVDEESQIICYLRKKGYEKDVTPVKEKAKLASALVRKGFSFDQIYRVMEESDYS